MGIDQSGAFLEQGRVLAKAAGLEPRLIEADIYDLPDDIGTFDLVLITIGVLNWMPDLDGFFRVIAGLLCPGGHLLVYETHPIMEMFDPESDTPHEPAISYFRTDPLKEEGLISYDGVDHGSGETGYWFIHTLGQIVTSCATAGMTITSLKEFGYSIREPEYDVYEGREAQIPMSYLFACKKDVISTSRQHSSNRLQWAQSRHPAMGWPNRKHPPPKSMSLLEPFGNP